VVRLTVDVCTIKAHKYHLTNKTHIRGYSNTSTNFQIKHIIQIFVTQHMHS